MSIAVSLLYAVLVLFSVSLNFFDPFTGVGIAKALPTAVLTAFAYGATRDRFGFWVTGGIALGCAGDFFLASMSKDWFLHGLGAFLLGHLCYLRAFTRDLHGTPGNRRFLLIACAALALLTAGSAWRLTATDHAILAAPVLVYGALLGVFMAVCVLHRSVTPWIGVGAVIFVISDAHIALNHMLLAAPTLPVTLSGYTLYYGSQYLIVRGAALETRAHHPSD
jgi:uncharacterized membrane protein YhhN